MADRLTPEQRREIGARVAAAPNTPWRACGARGGACDCGLVWASPGTATICVVMGAEAAEQEGVTWRPGAKQAAMHLIAHAPADLAALLADADAADAEIAGLRADAAKTRAAARWELNRYEGNRAVWLAERDAARSRLGEAVSLIESLAEPIRDHLGESYGVVLDRVDAFTARLPDPTIERTHHADCWRYHPGCAVARLEAVAEVRAGLVERAAKATGLESAALAEGQHGEADIHGLMAGTYEIAADLLGRALEG